MGEFAWEYPILAFVSSGWLVAIYLFYTPIFAKMMSEAANDGMVMNVVTPSVFLMLAVALNFLGWIMGYFASFEEAGNVTKGN